VYLFYFIIKQTSSCHPRANMRLYTYTGSTSNTVSTWREDRLTRPFQTWKIFFPYSPLLVLGITLSSRVRSVIWERWALIATLEGIPSWRDPMRAWGAIKNLRETRANEYITNALETRTQRYAKTYYKNLDLGIL